MEHYRKALHRISLASQNSMSSKEECGRIAREALRGPAQGPQAEVRVWCETCEGRGEIDETLGGYLASTSHGECPDCDGKGWIACRVAMLVSEEMET